MLNRQFILMKNKGLIMKKLLYVFTTILLFATSIVQIDAAYDTPLLKAARNGHLEIVKFLVCPPIRLGNHHNLTQMIHSSHITGITPRKCIPANINAVNNAGDTDLTLARNNGHAAVVAYLLSQGAR